MALKQTVAPTVEPITLAEVIAHRAIVASDQYSWVTNTAIPAARRAAENFLNVQLLAATWEETLAEFPASNEIRFSWSPVRSVTSVQYLDTDGVEQTWAAANYDTELSVIPSRLMPAYGVVWPTIRSGRYDSVTLTYVSGMGEKASELPEQVKVFCLNLVGHWFENREPYSMGERAWAVPHMLFEILRPIRNWRLD
jgi:uncharacterized phiE125 gp8 family phage protein